MAALKAQVIAAQNRFNKVGRGAGENFFRTFEAIFADIRAKADSYVDAAANSGSEEGDSLQRNMGRLLADLRKHDTLANEYVADVGRDDLPVGYMMLIERLTDELLPPGTNHLVHIRADWDYSTTRIGGGGVIFNLPAADPANVFLAPILVHEAAHVLLGKVIDEVRVAIDERLDDFNALNASYPARKGSSDSQYREEILPEWAEELFCDAVACLVTGPSFVLALASRLIGPPWSPDDGHPPAHLRIALCLRVFERSGWLSVLQHHAPDIGDWLIDISSRRPPREQANVCFLFEASEMLLDTLVDLAEAVVGPKLLPDEASSRNALEAARYFRHGILPVDSPATQHIDWELILGAWLLGLERQDFLPHAIPSVPYDSQLSGLVTKTIELSRIKQLWSEHDASR